MTTLKTKLTGCAVSMLALAASTYAADLSSVKITGYAAAAYQYSHIQTGTSTDTLFSGPGNAAKVAFSGDFANVKGMVSLYYVPNAPTELGVLDAYMTYDAGSGFTIKAGKYKSPLGLEAFDIPDALAITSGTTTGLIPTYHSGVQVNYTDGKDWESGLGVVDSIARAPGKFYAGDGSLKGNKGVEAFVSYKGITDTVLFAGVANEGVNGPLLNTKNVTIYDLYATYKINSNATAAAEWVYASKAAVGAKSMDAWLVSVNYLFTTQVSTAFRVSDGDVVSTGVKETRYTVAPAYKVNENFSVRGEVSFVNVAGPKDSTFFGLQGVLKF